MSPSIARTELRTINSHEVSQPHVHVIAERVQTWQIDDKWHTDVKANILCRSLALIYVRCRGIVNSTQANFVIG